MPVLPNSGGGLGQSILGGVDAFLNARRQKRADELFEQQIADAEYNRTKGRAQDAAAGLHVLGKGELAPMDVFTNIRDDAGNAASALFPRASDVSGTDFTSFVDPQPRMEIPQGTTPPIVSRAGAGAVNTPGAPQSFLERMKASTQASRGPRYEFGQGYYVDRQPQFDAQDAATSKMQGEKLFEAQIASMLADQGVNRDVRKAGLLAPIDVNKAIATEQGVGPIRSANATTQAINTARGVAPIDVGKALAISHGEMPDKLAIAAASAANAGGKPTDGQRQIAALVPEIRAAKETLSSMSNPTAFNTMLAKAGMFGNYLKTPEGQLYQQAANQFLNNLIYAKSGKTATDEERAALWHTYIDEPGDNDSLKAQKAAARDLALEGLGISGGSLVQPPARRPAIAPKTPAVGGDTGNIDLRLSITPQERAALKSRGFTDAQITAKYGTP